MIDNDFHKKGYVVIEGFMDKITTETISRYFENKIARKEWVVDDKDPVSGFSYYADPLIELLLKDSKPLVEEAVGVELIPTYSFSRVYRPGETLEPHVDRPSCEVSVTVNVANVGDPSPIFMEYPGKESNKYFLKPGDAVVYQGCVVKHWRETLVESQLTVQFMLHYVKKNGNFSSFKFDKREKLGMSSPGSQQKY